MSALMRRRKALSPASAFPDRTPRAMAQKSSRRYRYRYGLISAKRVWNSCSRVARVAKEEGLGQPNQINCDWPVRRDPATAPLASAAFQGMIAKKGEKHASFCGRGFGDGDVGGYRRRDR